MDNVLEPAAENAVTYALGPFWSTFLEPSELACGTHACAQAEAERRSRASKEAENLGEKNLDLPGRLKGKRSGATGQKKLPRYEGKKPKYHVNDAHVPGHRGFGRNKTPVPKDAEKVYEEAVPGSPTNPTTWWGRNAQGQIYRYSVTRDGTAHFSGIDGVGDGVRNITQYALDRLNGL